MAALMKRLFNLPQIITSFNNVQPIRFSKTWVPVIKPLPGVNGNYFRRIVHFKDEYTVEPLETTHLGGRDPHTGRVIAKKLGGGVKWKFHWVVYKRPGPSDLNESPREERVLDVFKCGCRTANVALISHGKELKYILATQNMKRGDIIRTHCGIPRNPVRCKEGDTYPLGALPIGTVIHNVEKYPGEGGVLVHSAGNSAKILRKEIVDGEHRVVIKIPSKREFSLLQTCMASVGRLSNIDHGTTHIGSVQKNRELGNRPASGLWQRKTGKHGRKIKPPKKVRYFNPRAEVQLLPKIRFTMNPYPPPRGKENLF